MANYGCIEGRSNNYKSRISSKVTPSDVKLCTIAILETTAKSY